MLLSSSFRLYIRFWVGNRKKLTFDATFSAATLIVNFLVAIIDESNRIAREEPKDPDFLEFITYTFKVSSCINFTHVRLYSNFRTSANESLTIESENTTYSELLYSVIGIDCR